MVITGIHPTTKIMFSIIISPVVQALSLPDCQLPKISYLNRLYLLNLITFQDAFPRRVVMIPPSIFERFTVFGTTFFLRKNYLPASDQILP